MGVSDHDWMRLACEEALQAQAEGEVPVGALILDREGRLLSRGRNQVIRNSDPCAHAEIMAIRNAAQALGNYRLDGCTLYVTLEPCAMCAGALVHARIKRLVFACRDIRAGAAGSVFNLLSGSPLNHRVQIDEGFLQADCSKLLRDFFEKRRNGE